MSWMGREGKEGEGNGREERAEEKRRAREWNRKRKREKGKKREWQKERGENEGRSSESLFKRLHIVQTGAVHPAS